MGVYAMIQDISAQISLNIDGAKIALMNETVKITDLTSLLNERG